MFLSLEADGRVSRRSHSAEIYRRAERRVTWGAEVRCDMKGHQGDWDGPGPYGPHREGSRELIRHRSSKRTTESMGRQTPSQAGLQWRDYSLSWKYHLQFNIEELYWVAVAGLLDTVEAVPQADGHPRRARHLG